jgi:hypothetical protein
MTVAGGMNRRAPRSTSQITPRDPVRTMMFPTRRPDAAGPLSIGSVMSRLMARAGYDREQSSAGLEAAWRDAAPESLRAASRPGLVRRGVLEVFVSHSAHVQELAFQKRAVVARLQSLLPTEGITDIRCRLMADAGGTS